jgi:hypothetical protein
VHRRSRAMAAVRSVETLSATITSTASAPWRKRARAASTVSSRRGSSASSFHAGITREKRALKCSHPSSEGEGRTVQLGPAGLLRQCYSVTRGHHGWAGLKIRMSAVQLRPRPPVRQQRCCGRPGVALGGAHLVGDDPPLLLRRLLIRLSRGSDVVDLGHLHPRLHADGRQRPHTARSSWRRSPRDAGDAGSPGPDTSTAASVRRFSGEVGGRSRSAVPNAISLTAGTFRSTKTMGVAP